MHSYCDMAVIRESSCFLTPAATMQQQSDIVQTCLLVYYICQLVLVYTETKCASYLFKISS
jgi:hypothetical protein